MAKEIMEGLVKTDKGIVKIVGYDGATFTPRVSEDFVLSWTNNMGLPNPPSVNLPSAENGKDGFSTFHTLVVSTEYAESYGVDVVTTSAAVITNGRNIQVGDFLLCDGVMYAVKLVDGNVVGADFVVDLRGGGGGLNTEAANLLIYVLKCATYKEDVSSQIERLEEILLGNSGGETDGGLVITDDGNGNVTITTYGNATIIDDGKGNATIPMSDGVTITDDGNGNVTIGG